MKHRLFTTATCLLLTLLSTQAAEVIWKDATPSGANPATLAAQREDWLMRVQANFTKTQGKKFDLIFDGDSITDGWQGKGRDTWNKYYVPLNATDFGISGDRTENVLWRLNKGQVDGMDPKLIVLMIGTNNLGRDSAAQIAEGITTVVNEYLKRCPTAHMLLLAVFPRNPLPTDPLRAKIAEINTKISELSQNPRVTYLDIGQKFLDAQGNLPKDIMPDALHPNEKGYQIWAEAIAPEIEKYFPSQKKD